MERPKNIAEAIFDDEAIQYIARRHHATSADVIDTIINDIPRVELEDNEKNIIRDLISMYNIK